MSFFGKQSPNYVAELLSPGALKRNDLFQASAVMKLVAKFKSGCTTSTKDNMALVGILSTQLLAHKFMARTQTTLPRMAGVTG